MLETAVIIAGGQGARLTPSWNTQPKARVKRAGQTLLEAVLRWRLPHDLKGFTGRFRWTPPEGLNYAAFVFPIAAPYFRI